MFLNPHAADGKAVSGFRFLGKLRSSQLSCMSRFVVSTTQKHLPAPHARINNRTLLRSNRKPDNRPQQQLDRLSRIWTSSKTTLVIAWAKFVASESIAVVLNVGDSWTEK
jgi:hypothetical protein